MDDLLRTSGRNAIDLSYLASLEGPRVTLLPHDFLRTPLRFEGQGTTHESELSTRAHHLIHIITCIVRPQNYSLL